MLFPKKVKYRKWQRLRGQFKGIETRGTSLAFGASGIKSLSSGQITSEQIEACRKVLTRYTAKGGKMWIRIFPDQPYTQKPPEVTMGAGKGDPVGYVAVVKPGRVLFEIDGLPKESASEALRKAQAKLPVKTKQISRE
ncbi:50S ribosomal protein L16 [Candidatus Giovannonibacteria bacterium RIFCSPLOWO2_02_FULL_43_11b]|uniref:Large ribosomal subunit protein uL16 n=1 Tax=Candidatus Giovannonibacteria bacterium RIFCSPHIGHO2_12_FULL_43_15 TaxID=1798341 RepID=A0A1F5WRD9_9BACT|nr:MAG: 50S ribosomal protein L16 [Candidatus Giovannonibacteria bacterium RIFCSPHIGHO2_01_FULL_43_100]OGF66966.1 MAG: 50S ribosomal protein L16 [Candidatus Giovannonibacteria bacterium RIFCSPHIGHO2_02_FULL_43_32]OGF78147.1 MAG: 50S ribosomal protein L16 [Candidatus Giovannonibacteria bacterium RIFCSPHIGHO2_12_FULL_43_15]OGF78554.1 MAG: 50S ribosomal protein L16 [Candidatus Giovannonibacteria bacterium RIFCSPLOWO2_01_FULL_43_60]OGF89865.1 MAG: 50S ribosomal protein L16 [Candidatus Giovannonibac